MAHACSRPTLSVDATCDWSAGQPHWMTDARPVTAQLLLNLSTWLIFVKRQRTSRVDDFGVVRRNQNVANELSISLASVLVSINTEAGNTSDIRHEMMPTRSIRLHVGLLWTGTNICY